MGSCLAPTCSDCSRHAGKRACAELYGLQAITRSPLVEGYLNEAQSSKCLTITYTSVCGVSADTQPSVQN